MTEPTIDRATFEALQEAAGADFVQEIVGTLLTEAPIMPTICQCAGRERCRSLSPPRIR
jgi:hypothetical protein